MSSPNFQLIRNALDTYIEQMKININDNPPAEEVKRCDSPSAVLELLERNKNEFKEYRDKNRKFIDCLNPVVQFVHAFSEILGEATSLIPLQPTKLVFVGINTLFSAAEKVSASYDDLLGLFERIGSFLKRLDIYAKVSLSPLMTEIITKIMVELLSILAQAKNSQGRIKQFAKKLLGDSEIANILRRLDQLIKDEAGMRGAHILEVVHGLMNNMKVVMDGGEASIIEIRKTLVTMQDAVNKINKMNRDRLHKDSRGWLSPPDPSENQVIARRDISDESAVWFICGNTFEEWNAKGCLLWIHGKPGSGKSILCSAIIKEAMALRDAALGLTAYYYFDFRNTAKQDVRGLLSSLLVQLCARSDSCYEVLFRLYSTHDNGSRLPDDKTLVNCLKDMLRLSEQPTIYLVVDALDECPSSSGVVSPRDRVLELIEDLVESHIPNLRICATSRPEADILDSLEPLASHIVSLHDEEGQKQDIIDYVTFVVQSDRKMRKWRAEDKKLVVDTISEKADGMFRWVFCQLEVLRRRIPGTIARALKEMPQTLDETYERILLGIDKDYQEYVRCLFQCLCFSIRPLRLAEIAGVLSVIFDARRNSEDHIDWRSEDAQQALLSACSSLVTIVNLDGSTVVQFAHFSVREYLTSDRLANARDHLPRYHVLPRSSHTTLARASLSVLCNLGGHVDKSIVEIHPLAIYAAQYWVEHAKFDGVSSSIQDLMEGLFDAGKPYFATWVWIYDVDRPWEGHMATMQPMQPKATPLYYAALCGFRNLVGYLAIIHPGYVNVSGGSHSSPLHAALAKREFDAALVLLEHGADINFLDYMGRSPLHTASSGGHYDVVKFLLEHQADVDIHKRSSRETPLYFATRTGQLEVVQSLVQHGASLDKTNVAQNTPLHLASHSGNLEITRFLIEQGANMMTKNKSGWTPLHCAARNGHPNIVEILLEGGVDANVRNANKKTPLDLASGRGNLGVVCLLIERGADVDCRDKQGWTPLHTAAQNGYLDIVRLLLDSSTDVHVRNWNRDTPLILASQGGHVEVSRFLMEHQADVNSVNEKGWTPLHSASQYGHVNVVKLLIDQGTNMNARTVDFWVPLHHASANGHLKVAELLINHGAEVDVGNEDQKTPLDLASKNGNVDVSRLLLKCGSNVNSQDKLGWTPSHSAARNGHLEVVKLLLDSGADNAMRDRNDKTPFDIALENGKRDVASFLAQHEGNLDTRLVDSLQSTSLEVESQDCPAEIVEQHLSTSLHNALNNGRIEVIQRLLDSGADVNKRGWDLQTPLYVASKNGELDLARTLIKYGADVNSRTTTGWTPLHVAALNGRVDAARLLLDNGADVDSRTTIGWTPLHTAARKGHVDAARLLLDNGAGVDVIQRNHETPLHTASCNNRPKVVQLLLERAANIQLRNANGRTPSQEASIRGHGTVVQLLSEHEYGVRGA